jgi:hypothetical protein
LQLIFKDESGAAEQAPNDCGYWSEDWNSFAAPVVADIDGRPAFANGPELPVWDHQPERVRPVNYTCVQEWNPFREPDIYAGYDDRPVRRLMPKQRSPLYDRRR